MARRSSGGKAPRKALATKVARKALPSAAAGGRHQKASTVPSGHGGSKSNMNVCQ
jgi:hypothetical protein